MLDGILGGELAGQGSLRTGGALQYATVYSGSGLNTVARLTV